MREREHQSERESESESESEWSRVRAEGQAKSVRAEDMKFRTEQRNARERQIQS